jgi:ketosteroid isomerase-like protein
MTTENSNEAQIRVRLDSWADAVRAKDIEAVMSHYAPDILSFDLAPPLKYSGANACRENWAAWFPTFEGPVGYEISELSIASGRDVAYSHSLTEFMAAGRTGSRPRCGSERLLASGTSTAGG